MSLLNDLGEYLKEEEVIEDLGVDYFMDYNPPDKDYAVYAMEYEGPPTTDGVQAVDRYVQINVKSESYTTAIEKAWEIFNVLDTPEDRVHHFNGRWASIWARGTPRKIDMDESRRTIVSFNVGFATHRD